MPLDKAYEMVMSGEIRDGKTIQIPGREVTVSGGAFDLAQAPAVIG